MPRRSSSLVAEAILRDAFLQTFQVPVECRGGPGFRANRYHNSSAHARDPTERGGLGSKRLYLFTSRGPDWGAPSTCPSFEEFRSRNFHAQEREMRGDIDPQCPKVAGPFTHPAQKAEKSPQPSWSTPF